MGGELAIALAIFLASAGAVIYFGTLLARYGDALATLTGWGRLFVGSILLATATSLPELSTNISAVRLVPPNPELALGNVLGANMLNMFTLAAVGLLFGGRRFLQRVAPEQTYLILLAIGITALGVFFAAIKLNVALWNIGLSAVVLLVAYLLGMYLVYAKRPQADGAVEDEDPGITLSRAGLMFTLASVGVIISGFFLAFSVDNIAEITGVASSTLGILAVSLVTTMPEAASTIAAARIGAMDLGVGGLYGSCVFNITILAYADPFYRQGILNNQSEPAHFVAGGIAIALMLMGMLLLILARNRLPAPLSSLGLVLMIGVYLAGAVLVATLGAPG